ncbi:UDP-glucuronosyltransferase 1A5-like isoform X2 [Myxocyprinus asiaticus]|uniref:UDP-glucuronosyltransferase 1A5-like isoform X2 n=1 Tax=Myxocyprinus asiaticus TaxID=70543 RepID=UPI002222C09F|nr:UDP-glucuronosyltransferase 1A5-like isoform X2 [Myxocyprinus asiaticus]
MIVRMAAFVLLLCLLCLGSAQAGRLLVVPSDGSHWIGMKHMVEELGRRGNQVVVVIPEASLSMGTSEHTTTLTYPVPYTKAQLQEGLNAGLSTLFSVDVSTDLARFKSFIYTLDMLKDHTTRNFEGLLFNEDLMKKLKDYNFDAILTDPFEPVGVVVAEYLSIPAIYMQVNHPCGVDTLASQSPVPASYVPQPFTQFTENMNFWQRSVNLVRALLQPMACERMFARADEIASRVLKRKTSMVEIMSRAALWFIRFDFAFEFPRPMMPNMIVVGGMDAKKAKPLPQELEEFVNGSGEHGFVVFTLGSMVSQLPEAKAKEFFEAFRQIPQRVLWRYTGPVPENAPKNVKLMKWLPQNDLLGHPKVKAFITHGGSHGIYEGICNGVPMVMLPLFGDQGDNVQRLVSRGVAETLSIYDITSEKLLVALRKVINDKSYKEKMTKLSAIHKDRPIEPLDLAVFWTEFVMRHKGAEHLRPAAHELNWIQYHCLDVIGFLILILVTVIFVTVKSCMFCFRKCFRKTKKNKKE